MTEKEFNGEIAKMIIETIKSTESKRGMLRLRQEGHFSPQMLTEEKLLNMKGINLIRLFLNIAMDIGYLPFTMLCMRIFNFIWTVGNDEDGTADNINRNHQGSPVNNLKNNAL